MTSTTRQPPTPAESRRRTLAGELRDQRQRLEQLKDGDAAVARVQRFERVKAAYQKAEREHLEALQVAAGAESTAAQEIQRLERELREIAPEAWAAHERYCRDETQRSFRPRDPEEGEVARTYLAAAKSAEARVDDLLLQPLSDREIVEQAAAIAAELRAKRAQL